LRASLVSPRSWMGSAANKAIFTHHSGLKTNSLLLDASGQI
jgi:hypothetical protein